MVKPYTTKDKKAIAARHAWAANFTRCWVCGERPSFPPLQTHEIRRRGECAEPFHVANYVRICQRCHEECHGGYLRAEVLAVLKWIHDEANFDWDWLNTNGLKRLLWRPV